MTVRKTVGNRDDGTELHTEWDYIVNNIRGSTAMRDDSVNETIVTV